MKKFWILYLLLLINGSVAIYLYGPRLTPVVMPYIPSFLKPDDPTLVTTTVITNKIVAMLIPKEKPTTDPSTPPKVLPEDDSFVSPAMEGIYYARANEQPAWGITHQKTSCYTAKGEHQGVIAGGVLLNCLKGKLTSAKGELFECLPDTVAKTNRSIFIARKDAHFFTGDYNKLAPKQLEMLVEYYQLSDKISERRKKILEVASSRNPYFQTSRTAYLALTKNIEEANALQQQLVTATDSRKMALDERLRSLKVKETRLKNTFDEAQKKFVEWKKKHASELPNPETDSMIKTWREEMKKMLPALPGLAFYTAPVSS